VSDDLLTQLMSAGLPALLLATAVIQLWVENRRLQKEATAREQHVTTIYKEAMLRERAVVDQLTAALRALKQSRSNRPHDRSYSPPPSSP